LIGAVRLLDGTDISSAGAFSGKRVARRRSLPFFGGGAAADG